MTEAEQEEEIEKELRMEEYDKAKHDAAWEKNFVLPLGREMKKRGIRYMVMILRDDGKLAYTLDTEIPGENEQGHARAQTE